MLVLAAPPEVVSGKVIAIHDGDTIKILVNERPKTIRLNAIDAPELEQPFGQRSKHALASFLLGKTVTVEGKSTDQYGRLLGEVRVGASSINERMIRDGMAWHFKRYDNSKELATIEASARSDRQGLWVDPSPEAPWDFRARSRTDRAGEERPAPSTGCVHVTATGTSYHSARCKHLAKSNNVISIEEAMARGLKACRACGGEASAN